MSEIFTSATVYGERDYIDQRFPHTLAVNVTDRIRFQTEAQARSFFLNHRDHSKLYAMVEAQGEGECRHCVRERKRRESWPLAI